MMAAQTTTSCNNPSSYLEYTGLVINDPKTKIRLLVQVSKAAMEEAPHGPLTDGKTRVADAVPDVVVDAVADAVGEGVGFD